MFIGRERELKSLNEVYSKAGFGMTIIYGRRRVGKSYLITEFIKDKKAIFYTATKVGAERNLEFFSKQVLDVLDPEYSDATFPSIESVILGLNFELYDGNGEIIAVISQKMLSIHDKYCIDIYKPEHEKVVVAILITLQHMIKDREATASTSASAGSSN